MKQPKLSFVTRNKRVTEMSDKKALEPPNKKSRKENVKNTTVKKGKEPGRDCHILVERNMNISSLEKERISPVKSETMKFSDSMKDVVKTMCKICR